MDMLTCSTASFLKRFRNFMTFAGLLLLSGCDLAIIEPNDGSLKSNFTFAIQDPSCNANCTVTFTNASQNATTFEWDFGDESAVSTLPNPVHVYATAGSYPVMLRASNDSIQHDTTLMVYINTTPVTGNNNFKAFVHTVTAVDAGSPHLTKLDNAQTNAKANKIVVVSAALGKRNTSAPGVYFFGSRWAIFNEDETAIQVGEKFHIVTAESGADNAWVHQTAAANLRTTYCSTLDHPLANGHPLARIFVTPIWEKSSDYNTHPLGVVYVNNRWEIMNLDKAALPTSLKFNVIVSEDEMSFTHTTASDNIIGDYSKINHALTNNNENVTVLTMMNQGTSVLTVANDRVYGLWYGPDANWSVFNQSGDIMPENARYNILVVE